jgi:hypothetical protein
MGAVPLLARVEECNAAISDVGLIGDKSYSGWRLIETRGPVGLGFGFFAS